MAIPARTMRIYETEREFMIDVLQLVRTKYLHEYPDEGAHEMIDSLIIKFERPSIQICSQKAFKLCDAKPGVRLLLVKKLIVDGTMVLGRNAKVRLRPSHEKLLLETWNGVLLVHNVPGTTLVRFPTPSEEQTA